METTAQSSAGSGQIDAIYRASKGPDLTRRGSPDRWQMLQYGWAAAMASDQAAAAGKKRLFGPWLGVRQTARQTQTPLEA